MHTNASIIHVCLKCRPKLCINYSEQVFPQSQAVTDINACLTWLSSHTIWLHFLHWELATLKTVAFRGEVRTGCNGRRHLSFIDGSEWSWPGQTRRQHLSLRHLVPLLHVGDLHHPISDVVVLTCHWFYKIAWYQALLSSQLSVVESILINAFQDL